MGVEQPMIDPGIMGPIWLYGTLFFSVVSIVALPIYRGYDKPKMGVIENLFLFLFASLMWIPFIIFLSLFYAWVGLEAFGEWLKEKSDER